MYIDDKFYTDISNLTTTSIIDPDFTVTPESFDDNNDMTRILTYAIPISCLAIIMVLLITVGIHRRLRVLEKWTSLKRMKNTDPDLYERSGLRRDSEYDLFDDNVINATIINDDTEIPKEPEYRVSTIT